MINSVKNLLLGTSLNSSLLCNPDECLSFIIVFLNLLTVFYLVYSSYKKITNVTIIFGYIWSCFIMCASVVVLVLHTCVFTIGGTVFTGMAIVAVLSMIFESKKAVKTSDEPETKKKDVGCYVIFPTTDNKFVFGLHDKRNNLLAMSEFKYNTVEEAKQAIGITRLKGESCEFEDLTQNWVVDAKHPKFRMFLKKQKYLFEFAVNEKLIVLKSEAIDEADTCLKMVKDARKCVTTSVIYFATAKKDIKNGKKFRNYPPEDDCVDGEVAEDRADAKTLAESLREMENIKTSSNVNKQTLYEFLNGKYGNKVILNRRENKTLTGLPLADTYYTYSNQKQENGKQQKKKVCFAYVYEKNDACLILAKLEASTARALRRSKKSITASKFPRSKAGDWYSLMVDDTFTEDEIHNILISAKEYCE